MKFINILWISHDRVLWCAVEPKFKIGERVIIGIPPGTSYTPKCDIGIIVGRIERTDRERPDRWFIYEVLVDDTHDYWYNEHQMNPMDPAEIFSAEERMDEIYQYLMDV